MINASGRVTRSVTRQLTARFADGWRARQPSAEIIARDVGVHPPLPVDEAWIAAAFATSESRSAEMQEALALSDALSDEIVRADAIVLGVPMYNFGMPGQLKSYIDQIVRIGRTFAFDLTAADPYLPLLESKPVIIVISAGDGSVHPGGALAHLNFLEPHLQTILGFIGLTDLHFVRVGYDEYQDDRFAQSIGAAQVTLEGILDRLTTRTPSPGQADLTPLPMPATLAVA